MPEMIPIEPDLGCTSVGNSKRSNTNLASLAAIIFFLLDNSSKFLWR